MKIKWIKNKNGKMNTYDITQVVSTITWSGSVSQAARTIEISVLHAPDDDNIKKLKLNLAAGDAIKVHEQNELIFYGQIQTAKKTGETGTVTYTCYDLLNHLLKSTGVYNFSNTTPEQITKKICADLQIKTGKITETKAPIRKLIVDGDNFYDIIMKAYTKASRQTGKKYICRMDGTKLSVQIKGKKVKNFVLAQKQNITGAEYEETIENMVNVVRIYDEQGVQVGEVRNKKWVEKYGVFQGAYKKENGINEKSAAKEMLRGTEKKVSVEGINGDLNCIAGNGVKVYDSSAGLHGLFWIDSDTHTWENGIHTMNLELNFKNIMDSKEADSDEQEVDSG